MDAADQVGAALRRWKWLLLAAALAGVAASVGVAQLRGERWEATAQVLQRDSEAAAVLGAGTPADPQREGATGVLLAQSARFYRDVVQALPASARDGAADVRGDFEVRQEAGTDVLGIVGASADPDAAVTIANTVAEEYVRFRADTLAQPLRDTARELQEEGTAAGDAQARETLSRLRLLENLARREATVVDTADRARRTRPAVVRDALIGLSTGIVAGLLLIALLEALTGRSRALKSLQGRLGASAAIVMPPGGSGRGAAERELAEALGSARNGGNPAVVAVEAPLDGSGARDAGVAAVAAALDAMGDDAGEWVVRGRGADDRADAAVIVVRSGEVRTIADRLPGDPAPEGARRVLLVLDD